MLALGAGVATAQSLGEIARRERERRGTLTQHSPVLTNEDFQRRKILEPVREPIRESVAQPATPVAAPVIEAPVAAPVQVSLGEYARQLREQRAARLAASAPVVAVVPTPVTQPAPAAVTRTSAEPVRFRDTAGRPVLLGEYARQLRQQRQSREAAPQVAVKVDPTPPRVSLGEYARGLQIARKAKRLEIIESVGDVSASVVGVQRGDTLWKLSAFYLGRGDLWTTLWKANPQLSNPNLIRPGQVLRLPDTIQLARNTAPRPETTVVAGLNAAIAAAPFVPAAGSLKPPMQGISSRRSTAKESPGQGTAD